MSFRRFVLPLLLSGLIFSGCSSNKKASADLSEGVQTEVAPKAAVSRSNQMYELLQKARGKTPQEILDNLGEPDSRIAFADGVEVWEYTFDNGNRCSLRFVRNICDHVTCPQG